MAPTRRQQGSRWARTTTVRTMPTTGDQGNVAPPFPALGPPKESPQPRPITPATGSQGDSPKPNWVSAMPWVLVKRW